MAGVHCIEHFVFGFCRSGFIYKSSLKFVTKLDYELRFFRDRGYVAELNRETTDYYTTSFADSRRGKSGMVGFRTIGTV